LTEENIQLQKLHHKEAVQKYNSTLSEEQKILVTIQASQTKVTNELLLTAEDFLSRKKNNKEAVKKYRISKKSNKISFDIPVYNTNENMIFTDICDNADMGITDHNMHVDNILRDENIILLKLKSIKRRLC